MQRGNKIDKLEQNLGVTSHKNRYWGGQNDTIQHNNTESMLSPTNDRWPRTMLVCG